MLDSDEFQVVFLGLLKTRLTEHSLKSFLLIFLKHFTIFVIIILSLSNKIF